MTRLSLYKLSLVYILPGSLHHSGGVFGRQSLLYSIPKKKLSGLERRKAF